MEKLENTSILRFHPNTLEYVRKEFGLDKPGVIDQSLDILDRWLKQQDHFVKKDFSNEYIERSLVFCKGSVEKTKEKMEKMCKVRTTHPKFFETFESTAEYEPYAGGVIDALLPTLTPEHGRVYFTKNIATKSKDLMGFYRRFMRIVAYLRRYDYFVGVHLIADLTDVNIMELVTKMNPVDLLNCSNIGIDAFSMRVRSMHLITTSKVIDVLVTIIKQAMSAKLRKRIHVHQTFDQLPEEFPKSMIPKDYGGLEKNLQDLNDDLSNALKSAEFEKYLEEMSYAVINGHYRRKNIGLPWSFRKLAFD